VELFLQGRSYPPSAWPKHTEVKAVEKRKQQQSAREKQNTPLPKQLKGGRQIVVAFDPCMNS